MNRDTMLGAFARFSLGLLLVCVLPVWGLAVECKVGYYDNPPLVFKNEKGEPDGLFVDFLESVAEAEGWSLSFVHGTFLEVYGDVEAGRVDLVPAVAASYQRRKEVDFNRLAIIENWAVLYQAPDVVLNNLFDLEGRQICAVAGDIHLTALRDVLDRYEISAEIIEVDDYQQAMEAIDKRKVDAALVNRTFSTRHGGEFKSISTLLMFNPIPLHFAMPKRSNAEMIHLLDQYLETQRRKPNSALQIAFSKWMRPEKHWVIPPWVYWGGALLGCIVIVFALFSWLLKGLVRLRTEQLQVEKERSENALRAQNLFLGMLSHELRTPLNYIVGSVDTLRNEMELGPELSEIVEPIEIGAIRLQHLITSLLRFADLDREDFKLLDEEFKLLALFDEVNAITKVMRYRKDVLFDQQLEVDPTLVVRADESALFQIVVNLLNNAFKFTEKGQVAFYVSAEVMPAIINLEIRVSDTGPGIPLENQNDIFVPFHRGSDSHSTEEGAGLGLSIVSKLIRLMDGSISLESEMGHGSVFTVNLQLARVLEDAVVVQSS